MTTFVDTGRLGKKRYRVRYQGMGGSRTAELPDMNYACREYYQREKALWLAISEKEAQRKRPVTIRELMIFYFGRLCDELEMNNISRDYFLGQQGIFFPPVPKMERKQNAHRRHHYTRFEERDDI